MKMLFVSSASVMSLYKANSAPRTFKPSQLNANRVKDFIVTISSEARIKQIQAHANSTAKRLMGELIVDKDFVPPHGSTFRRKIQIKI